MGGISLKDSTGPEATLIETKSEMNSQHWPCFQVEEEAYVETTAGSPGFYTRVLVGFKVAHGLILEHLFAESRAHQIKVTMLCGSTASVSGSERPPTGRPAGSL